MLESESDSETTNGGSKDYSCVSLFGKYRHCLLLCLIMEGLEIYFLTLWKQWQLFQNLPFSQIFLIARVYQHC